MTTTPQPQRPQVYGDGKGNLCWSTDGGVSLRPLAEKGTELHAALMAFNASGWTELTGGLTRSDKGRLANLLAHSCKVCAIEVRGHRGEVSRFEVAPSASDSGG